MIYKIIILLLSINLMSSCSAERHLIKAKKHIEKAKKKGAVIKQDTVWQYKYDIDTVWNNTTNSFETRHLIKDSFPYVVTNTISVGMTRQERKYMQDMFKHMERMMKLQNDSLRLALKAQVKQNKQNSKTQRTTIRREKSTVALWIILAILLIVSILLIKFNK